MGSSANEDPSIWPLQRLLSQPLSLGVSLAPIKARQLDGNRTLSSSKPALEMDREEENPRRIVRVYSHHAQDRFPPESDARLLSRVLTDQEPSLDDILEPWRRFYEPWSPPDADK